MKLETELNLYIKASSKYPILSRKEEVELARLVQAGDHEARQKLISSNLLYVVKIAHGFKGYFNLPTISLTDLVQEGNIGLMRAIDKFDPEKGFKLVTYARWWITSYIKNYVMKNFHPVKIGTTKSQRALFFKTGKVFDIMNSDSYDEKSKGRESLALQLKIRVEDVISYEKRISDISTSLDSPLGDLEGSSTRHEVISNNLPTPENIVVTNDVSERVNKVLNDSDISEKEMDVIKKRFFSTKHITLREIANTYGVTRERIRQIEKSALKKLFEDFSIAGITTETML